MYLCIDQGGQGSRAVVCAANGDILGAAARSIETTRGPGLCVEHDPDVLLQSVRGAVSEALATAAVGPDRIEAAGLATQRSSLVCLDGPTGEPLSPVISWQDRRAAAWLAQFEPKADRIKAKTGLPLSPHYGVSKIAWCLDHLSAVRHAAEQSRLIAAPLVSFLLHHLLAERPWLVDPANASRTLLMDAARLCWDPTLLDLFGIPKAVLPAIVPTRHRYGHLAIQGAGIPLKIATGDQAAAIFAWGEPGGGDAFVNIGTGAFIQVVTGATPVVDAALLSSIACVTGEQRLYVLEGTVNGAGSALDVARKDLALTSRELHAGAPAWLRAPGTDLLFLNGVGGLGSPDWIADFPSRHVGDGSPEERIVAVYESIVFLIMRNLERIRRHVAIDRIVVSGGLSRLDGLCQRLADLAALTVLRPAAREATALGVGVLLGVERQRVGFAPDTARFGPAANAGLAARYRRWSALLEADIDAGS